MGKNVVIHKKSWEKMFIVAKSRGKKCIFDSWSAH